MLVEMAKVEIIGSKKDFSETVSLVHDLGDLHIEELKRCVSDDVPVKAMEVVGEERERLDTLKDLLVRVRTLIKALDVSRASVDRRAYDAIYAEVWASGDQGAIDAVRGLLADIEERVAGLSAEAESIESELVLLDRYAPILEKIAPLARQVMATGAFDAIALRIERRYKAVLDELIPELERLTGGRCEMVTADVDEETTAAILVYAREHSAAVHRYLSDANVNQIKLPSELADKPFDAAYDEIRDRLRVLPARLKTVRSELEYLSSMWYTRLSALRDVLIDRIDEIGAVCEFGQTEYAFVITGWMPASDVPLLEAKLDELFGGEVVVERLEVSPDEYRDVPVAMKHSRIVTPFEGLLAISGAPRYGTIDPTALVAIFYPLFFGMIVGDVGYGIVMLTLVLWLRAKYKDVSWMRTATAILGPAATMAIVFGFVYGEFFGNLGEIWGLVPAAGSMSVLGVPWPFVRMDYVRELMVVALGVGFLQVALGLALGVVNAFKTHSRAHMMERGGLLAVLFGFPLLLGVTLFYADKLDPRLSVVLTAVGALLMLIGAFFAFKGGKVLGAVEILGQFGNVVSYLRIMAVGLAGAIFADATNEIVMGLMGQDPALGTMVLALTVGIVLHSLNIAIAAFSPNIHALRLNFLEFFGKFFESGTRRYEPFHRTGKEEG